MKSLALSPAILSVVLLLGGCAALDMGQASSNLKSLIETQVTCREKTKDFSEVYQDNQMMLSCVSASEGLVKLSEDAFKKANETGIDNRNAVFFHRIAAIAAWQSFNPTVMNNGFEYARAGLGFCGAGETKVQPGDCAILGVVRALIGQDQAELAYRQILAGSEAAVVEKKKVSPSLSGRDANKIRLERLTSAPGDSSGPAAPGKTRLGENARDLFDDGWRELGKRRSSLANARVDESMRGYARQQEDQMVANLKARFDTLFKLFPAASKPDFDYGNHCREEPGGDNGPGTVTLKDSEAGDLDVRVFRLLGCLSEYAASNKQLAVR